MLHRWIGVVSLTLLFVSVITGLLWANARFLYWPEGYMEKVNKMEASPLETASIPLRQVFEQIRKIREEEVIFDRATLRPDFGRLIYEIEMRSEEKPEILLVDANTGELLSPISEPLAQAIARQYVKESPPITSVSMEQYIPRKKHAARGAIRVRFDDRSGSEIILDRQSGEILEDESQWRKFHFFVMRVHQLNFFGFEKTLLNFTGIPMIFMGLSGVLLLQMARKRRAAARDRSVQVAEESLAPESKVENGKGRPLFWEWWNRQ